MFRGLEKVVEFNNSCVIDASHDLDFYMAVSKT